MCPILELYHFKTNLNNKTPKTVFKFVIPLIPKSDIRIELKEVEPTAKQEEKYSAVARRT